MLSQSRVNTIYTSIISMYIRSDALLFSPPAP